MRQPNREKIHKQLRGYVQRKLLLKFQTFEFRIFGYFRKAVPSEIDRFLVIIVTIRKQKYERKCNARSTSQVLTGTSLT